MEEFSKLMAEDDRERAAHGGAADFGGPQLPPIGLLSAHSALSNTLLTAGSAAVGAAVGTAPSAGAVQCD